MCLVDLTLWVFSVSWIMFSKGSSVVKNCFMVLLMIE
jgi:hypothetical protein